MTIASEEANLLTIQSDDVKDTIDPEDLKEKLSCITKMDGASLITMAIRSIKNICIYPNEIRNPICDPKYTDDNIRKFCSLQSVRNEDQIKIIDQVILGCFHEYIETFLETLNDVYKLYSDRLFKSLFFELAIVVGFVLGGSFLDETGAIMLFFVGSLRIAWLIYKNISISKKITRLNKLSDSSDKIIKSIYEPNENEPHYLCKDAMRLVGLALKIHGEVPKRTLLAPTENLEWLHGYSRNITIQSVPVGYREFFQDDFRLSSLLGENRFDFEQIEFAFFGHVITNPD